MQLFASCKHQALVNASGFDQEVCTGYADQRSVLQWNCKYLHQQKQYPLLACACDCLIKVFRGHVMSAGCRSSGQSKASLAVIDGHEHLLPTPE